ncbi:MAG: hypothetical protein ABR505_04270 [Actinomycetota bacterium]
MQTDKEGFTPHAQGDLSNCITWIKTDLATYPGRNQSPFGPGIDKGQDPFFHTGKTDADKGF